MSFQYGVPATGQPAAVDKPRCWGSQYDNSSRECGRCSVQSTCRDEVIRINNARSYSPQQPQPAPFVPQAPAPMPQPQVMRFTPQTPAPMPQQQMQQYPTFQPMPTIPAQVPQPPRPPGMPVMPPQYPQYPQPQYQQQAPQMTVRPGPVLNSQQQYQQPQLPYYSSYYGQVQDPMFQYLTTTPPLFRPQMRGETFIERVAKNALLGAGEAVLAHCLLGLRQFFWAPTAPDVVMTQVDGVYQQG